MKKIYLVTSLILFILSSCNKEEINVKNPIDKEDALSISGDDVFIKRQSDHI